MNAFLAAVADTRVYPITDTRISGWSHAQQVELLSGAGARLIQLRDKKLSPGGFYREAVAAVAVARAWGVKIIINDRVDIAVAVKADGVHLGQDDLPPTAARHLLGPNLIIGYSTHTTGQAEEAAQLPIDYVAIGPVFTTGTKEAAEPVVGLPGVAVARKIVGSIPLVAIGGITSSTFKSVVSAGADVAAVIADLWPQGGGQPKPFTLFS